MQENHWTALHTYRPITWDAEKAKLFYAEWNESIPSYDCDCKTAWQTITFHNPPHFDSWIEFFKWGVDRHNDVNRKLDKPEFSFYDALVLYYKLTDKS